MMITKKLKFLRSKAVSYTHLVGRSQKFELCIEECGIDKLDVFSNIMEITGKRDRFFIRDNDYFEKILNYFSGDAELFLVSTTYRCV